MVGYSSNGGSGDGIGAHPDEPVCRHTTVPVSSHAAGTDPNARECSDGSPTSTALAKLTALKPRSALRRISPAATSGSGSQVNCNGMIRPG